MTSRIADLLRATRHHQFVGRAAELALFQSALAAPELPFHILSLYGPGGVGKTTLLGALAETATHRGVPVSTVDARNMEPSPDGFLRALSHALGLASLASPLDVLAARSGRHILFIDTYETLAPLDAWIREEFLPQLPEDTLVVIAGRNGPGPAWLTDSGWQGLLRRQPLGNLGVDDSRNYLTHRAVPDDQHQAVTAFTHGHPLALSLVADVFAQRPDTHFDPSVTPDVVKTLVEQLVQKAPGPAHRAALEASALLRQTTEALLAELLAIPDAHEIFEWLCARSFMQLSRPGVFPHDLAREALGAELRWRNPDWYAEPHRRARTHYAARLQQTSGAEQQRVLFDFFFLHRDNPVVRPFFEWQESGSTLPERLSEDDVPRLVAMVERHEGDASARLAAYWLARQPEGVLVFRAADRQPAGFVTLVALHHTKAADTESPPILGQAEFTAAVRAALRASPRDAKGYRALYYTYFRPAPTQERAAELLEWPFSTFRRHLEAGCDRLAGQLWAWEIEGTHN